LVRTQEYTLRTKKVEYLFSKKKSAGGDPPKPPPSKKRLTAKKRERYLTPAYKDNRATTKSLPKGATRDAQGELRHTALTKQSKEEKKIFGAETGVRKCKLES